MPHEELAFPTVAWALARARQVLSSAPAGAWSPDDDDANDDNCASASGGGVGDGVGGAWFAPQQRSKTAAPPGYIEA